MRSIWTTVRAAHVTMASALTRSTDTSVPASRDTQVSCFRKSTQIVSKMMSATKPCLLTDFIFEIFMSCIFFLNLCGSDKGSGVWVLTKASPGEFTTNKGVEGQLASEYTVWLRCCLTLPPNPPPGAPTCNLPCLPIQRKELPGIWGVGVGGGFKGQKICERFV